MSFAPWVFVYTDLFAYGAFHFSARSLLPILKVLPPHTDFLLFQYLNSYCLHNSLLITYSILLYMDICVFLSLPESEDICVFLPLPQVPSFVRTRTSPQAAKGASRVVWCIGQVLSRCLCIFFCWITALLLRVMTAPHFGEFLINAFREEKASTF